MKNSIRRLFGGFVAKTGMWGLTGLLFLLVGLATLPFGIVSQVQNQHFRSIAKTTQGVVVAQQVTGSRGGGTDITFVYSVHGYSYSAEEAAPNNNILGLHTAVIYNPAHPQIAKLADTKLTNEGELFGLSTFFVVAAFALSLVGYVWRTLRTHTRSKAE
jgi:hypothetical protein